MPGRKHSGNKGSPYIQKARSITDQQIKPGKGAYEQPHTARRRVGRWGHTYAALDLGTNNCRLLVAKPLRRGFRVIDAFSRNVRLGEGVEQTGYLSQDAMDRAVDALKVCAQKIERRRVTRTHAIATEACRLAGNGAQFIARVQAETGLSLDIIPADEEARLAVTGCASLVDRSCDSVLIFDIGGGSTELVWLDLRRVDEHCKVHQGHGAIQAWVSLPFGVTSLSERYGIGTIEPAVFEEMVLEVVESLTVFDEAESLRPTFEQGCAHMLGTSGTVTTMAGVYLGLECYDRAQVDGAWVDVPRLREVSHRLASMDYESRMAEPCIGEERADLVIAGCAIFEAITRVWPCQRMRVADRGLREGMLLALMEKADKEHRVRRGRHRAHQKAPSGKS